MNDMYTALRNCSCPSCRDRRDKVEYIPTTIKPFTGILGNYHSTAASNPLPFEPEAEPVYTHVLADYDEDGTALEWAVELHTAQSLVEAIALRSGSEDRFQVFKLGRLILDVNPE